jgi:hypothetical protein
LVEGEVAALARKWEEEVAALARKWEEEVAEEEGHLLQAVVALVSRCLVGEVEEQEVQSFHSVPGLEVEVVAAFLLLQHSRLGRKNPLEEVVEGHLRVQVEEAVPKRCACPRKAEVH